MPRDIMPIFTIDVAALTIQRKWRAHLVKQYLRALVSMISSLLC